MWVTQKCMNRDCKDYDQEWIYQTSLHVQTEKIHCPSCLVGRMHIRMDLRKSESASLPIEEEQGEVSAEFNIRNILNK